MAKKFYLLKNGDALRDFARKCNLFLYPYDILTGADMALFEDPEEKSPDLRYIVCSLEEMKPKGRGDTAYMLKDVEVATGSYYGRSPEVAISFWNKRIQERAQRLLKPVFRQFLSLERYIAARGQLLERR